MTGAPPTAVELPYVSVARQKLIVMSMTTLSLYQLYWFYTNFQRMRARTGSGASPFWRAIAAPITAHLLFSAVRTDAQSRFVTVRWSALGLAVIYFVLTLCCFLDYPWWTITLLSVLALLPAHATMDAVNRTIAPDAPPTDSYSATDGFVIVVGIALTLIGLYFTREAKLFVEQLVDQL